MTKLTKEVWKVLDENLCIRVNMRLGIINNAALVRYMIEEKNINGSKLAVMGALRRYKGNSLETIFDNAHKVINKSITLSTKSSLANISLVKDAEIQKLLSKVFSCINYNKGHTLRLIEADASIKIIVDKKNLKKIKKIFPEDKVLKVDEHIAEINIHMHPDAACTPGVLSVVTNELAVKNINLVESVGCFPEWLCFVEEKDLLKAYTILHDFVFRKI